MLSRILPILLCAPLVAHGSTSEKHGIFWYETPPKKEAAPEEEFPKPVIPSAEVMYKMHPKQLKKLLEDAHEYGIYKLTPEATLDYYKVLDVVRRKGAAFTSLSGYVMLQNPDLNGAMDYPVTRPGNAARVKQMNEDIDNTLVKNRSQYALLYFSQPQCGYCLQQHQILENFVRDTGWYIKEIDIIQKPEAAAKFNVDRTPVTVLIKKDSASNQWMPVSVGVDSLSSIKANIARMVRQLNGDSSPQQFYTDPSQNGGFFDPMAKPL